MSETLVRFGEADLTDCDREPIHIPGSVQPHGALLALDPDTLVVLMAGGATKRLLGRPPEALIGQSLRAELTGLELAKFSALTVRPVSLRQSKLLLDTGAEGVRLDVSASKNDGLLLLELEERFELPGVDRVEIVQGSLSICRSLAAARQTRTSRNRSNRTSSNRVFVINSPGSRFRDPHGIPAYTVRKRPSLIWIKLR